MISLRCDLPQKRLTAGQPARLRSSRFGHGPSPGMVKSRFYFVFLLVAPHCSQTSKVKERPWREGGPMQPPYKELPFAFRLFGAVCFCGIKPEFVQKVLHLVWNVSCHKIALTVPFSQKKRKKKECFSVGPHFVLLFHGLIIPCKKVWASLPNMVIASLTVTSS